MRISVSPSLSSGSIATIGRVSGKFEFGPDVCESIASSSTFGFPLLAFSTEIEGRGGLPSHFLPSFLVFEINWQPGRASSRHYFIAVVTQYTAMNVLREVFYRIEQEM